MIWSHSRCAGASTGRRTLYTGRALTKTRLTEVCLKARALNFSDKRYRSCSLLDPTLLRRNLLLTMNVVSDCRTDNRWDVVSRLQPPNFTNLCDSKWGIKVEYSVAAAPLCVISLHEGELPASTVPLLLMAPIPRLRRKTRGDLVRGTSAYPFDK